MMNNPITLMLAGSVLSMLLGYFAQIRINGSERRKQNEINYKQIVKQFKLNLGLLVEIENRLSSPPSNVHPDFRLDLTALDFLFATGPDCFPSRTEYEYAEHCRYQLHHINCELMILLAIEQRPDYLSQVLVHIRGEMKNIRKITDRCNKSR